MSEDLKIEEAPSQAAAGDLETHTSQLSKGDNVSLPVEGVCVNAAMDFLSRLRPGGPWTIVSYPSGKCRAHLIRDRDGLEAYLTNSPERDWYFVIADMVTPKAMMPEKHHLLGSRWVWVELDPGEAGETTQQLYDCLVATHPLGVHPHIVVRSGRGVWGFWELAELGQPDDVEAVNFKLMKNCHGDKYWNINRVARLPGTLNSKTGRRATWENHESPPLVLSDLPKEEPQGGSAGSASLDIDPDADIPVFEPEDIAELAIPPRARQAAMSNPQGSRNENARSFLRSCLGGNVDHAIILGVCMSQAPVGHFFQYQRVKDTDRFTPRRDPLRFARDQLSKALAEHNRVKVAEEAEDTDMSMTENGKAHDTPLNFRRAARILDLDLWYDEFANTLMTGDEQIGGLTGNRIRIDMEEKLRLKLSKDRWWDLAINTCIRNTRHPVREYLSGLTWDGEHRCETWLIDLAGADDTRYVRAVSKLLLLAGVWRVLEPGCKYDELLVLESGQGMNKSSAMQRLAVRREWFIDDLPLGSGSREVIEQATGKWIIETAELTGRKSDLDRLKSFLSRGTDKGRRAYARVEEELPRHWVAVGTTNESNYLRDETGNRRFWPVKVQGFDLEAMTTDLVDQLWAEAVHWHGQGLKPRLDRSLWAAAKEQQDARMEAEDPWLELLAAWLPEGDCKVSSEDVWAVLKVPEDRREQRHNDRIGRAMRALGFEKKRLRRGGGKTYAYVRGHPADWTEADPEIPM